MHRVPEYAEKLAAPADVAMARVVVRRPYWRMNWAITDQPALHQPTGFLDAAAGRRHRGDIGREVFVRVERQTFVRLPVTGAIVFGIRTFVRPLASAFPTPEDRARVAATLSTVPEGDRHYKSLTGLADDVLVWCRAS
jgi:hypothetical protein